MSNGYFTKTDLRARGWNESMIHRFLRRPDQTKTNPHYRSGPPMQLFEGARVVRAEQQPEFIAIQEKRARRRAGARKAVETKSDKTRQFVDSLNINVPCFDRQKLIAKACAHYNAFTPGREDDYCKPARLDSDDGFLNRIAVNFLRHRMTPYERHLARTYGKVGADEAYVVIKTKVLHAIATAYPFLAGECNRQVQDAAEERTWE